ncbi:hypothetical protein ANCDUO_12947 [Ancylostoma duodenale]|uniref:Uncharacterized protein n=1 Tax=Ancylostoma duodenale TaxID=51022 RepID=A0A0C2GDF7_9BILA|nr:hypothetical protein ANCDUO_12947 [Ancylostoma duodenale]
MRLLFLVLLLALCANAGFFDTRLGEKIKQALSKIEDAFNSTALVAIREKFNGLKEKIKAKLTLSPERKAKLEELLKRIIKIKKDKVQEDGDSIEEINERNHVAELLYQGDIVLTKKQAKEIVEDIEGDNGRIKRQMFRDYSASWNGQPTMVPNDPKYVETLGSPIISFYELLMINKHYGCDETGEYQFQPDGCGAVYEATTEYKTFRDVVGNKTAGQRAREDFDFCYNWIKAPKGSKIELKIAGLSKGLAVDGCLYWGVEIKTQADQRLTGYRFCAPEDVGVTLKSASNIVPIITYNRFYATMVDIQYRIGAHLCLYRPQKLNWTSLQYAAENISGLLC